MLAFLRNLLGHTPRRSRQRNDLRFVLITRQGCHLCEEAFSVLEQTRKRHGIGLEIVDVDSSADLLAQYGESVPVVLVNDKVRFRGNVNKVLLERIIEKG